jgi:hypothetical protein
MTSVWLVWLLLLRLRWLFYVVAAVDYGVTSNHLRVSIRHEVLHDAPSCQHRIVQVELLNVVRIQTTTHSRVS